MHEHKHAHTLRMLMETQVEHEREEKAADVLYVTWFSFQVQLCWFCHSVKTQYTLCDCFCFSKSSRRKNQPVRSNSIHSVHSVNISEKDSQEREKGMKCAVR